MGLRDYRATRLPSCRTTVLHSYRATGLQRYSAGRWLLIDILTAPNRASIIRRPIDSIVGPFAHLVERF